MSEVFEKWWKNNSLDMFWYKHRLIMGFDPENPNTIEESLYWKRVNNQREKCLDSKDPEYAILNAPYFDKQYHLQKWWEDLNDYDKKRFLIHVWFNKADGNLYGFDWWLPYFEEVGFISNIDETLPTEPITLYRGIEPLFMKGMSWTPQIEMARHFSESVSLMEDKKLFKTEVDPEYILAILEENAVGYKGELITKGIEYVVNHQKLGKIEEFNY
ncbi:hypothetical protein GJU41_22550 [Bacillus idriensis]|uniref:DUF3841 domain-containing protein n=1 Tax=Metabacillus idriensis TaxID=324768 RepID=A0A6I2MHW8_9BACI|nr:hypothetical protein [Metabacillus idriensis]MRX56727.1 hypothetical protein [Metabacillus idriensis]